MKILKLIALLNLFSFTIFAQTYTAIDDGSNVNFTIKNFGIKTTGSLTGLNGTIIFAAGALGASKMNVSVATKSINTNNNTRDKHLRKQEYFDIDQYPTISFVSSKITESNLPNRFFVVGTLTIKGIAKQVQFGFTATTATTGLLFEGEFEINRRDFGVGGKSAVLSDILKVQLKVNAKK